MSRIVSGSRTASALLLGALALATGTAFGQPPTGQTIDFVNGNNPANPPTVTGAADVFPSALAETKVVLGTPTVENGTRAILPIELSLDNGVTFDGLEVKIVKTGAGANPPILVQNFTAPGPGMTAKAKIAFNGDKGKTYRVEVRMLYRTANGTGATPKKEIEITIPQ